MLAGFAEFVLTHAPGAKMARVPASRDPAERGELPCPLPAFEKDNSPLLVNDLRELKLRKLLLQSVALRSVIAGERRFPFNFA